MADDYAGELSEEEWALFLESHPPSISGVNFSLLGFETEESAQQVADVALVWTSMFSRLFPLQSLDGITFAADYPQALAALDRGFPTKTTLTATEESFGLGVAMSPVVKRLDKMKTHVVIAAKLGLDLLSDKSQERDAAIHILAHELGHVAEHEFMDIAFPGIMLSILPDRYESALHPYAHPAFSEYFAERAAANFGLPVLEWYQEMFLEALREMVSTVRDIRSATSMPSSIRSTFRSSSNISTSSAGCSAMNLGKRGTTWRRAKVTAAQILSRPVRAALTPRALSSALSASSMERRA